VPARDISIVVITVLITKQICLYAQHTKNLNQSAGYYSLLFISFINTFISISPTLYPSTIHIIPPSIVIHTYLAQQLVPSAEEQCKMPVRSAAATKPYNYDKQVVTIS